MHNYNTTRLWAPKWDLDTDTKVAILDGLDARTAFAAVIRRFVAAAIADRDSHLQSTVETDIHAMSPE